MDRISRCSRGEHGVWFGNLRVVSLLFAGDVSLLASSSFRLQCESEAMVVRDETLLHVEEFKNSGSGSRETAS